MLARGLVDVGKGRQVDGGTGAQGVPGRQLGAPEVDSELGRSLRRLDLALIGIVGAPSLRCIFRLCAPVLFRAALAIGLLLWLTLALRIGALGKTLVGSQGADVGDRAPCARSCGNHGVPADNRF